MNAVQVSRTSCATFFISSTYAAMALSLLMSPSWLQASLTHPGEHQPLLSVKLHCFWQFNSTCCGLKANTLTFIEKKNVFYYIKCTCYMSFWPQIIHSDYIYILVQIHICPSGSAKCSAGAFIWYTFTVYHHLHHSGSHPSISTMRIMCQMSS